MIRDAFGTRGQGVCDRWPPATCGVGVSDSSRSTAHTAHLSDCAASSGTAQGVQGTLGLCMWYNGMRHNSMQPRASSESLKQRERR